MLIKLFFYSAILIMAIFGYRSYAAGHPPLNIGDSAPEFNLSDANGKRHSLADYRGQYVILYFYPKDDTPGCTQEACKFRDDWPKLQALGASILGISVDNSASHQKFSEKHRLPFPLLADEDGKVAASYDALTDLWVIKIAKRHSFLIDPNGKIVKLYRQVSVSNHSQQIIEDLQAIKQKAETL